MKIIITISVIFLLGFNDKVYAQNLTNEEDSIINILGQLRYNYPDSALTLVEEKIKHLEIVNPASSYFLAELLFIKSATLYVKSDYLGSRNAYEALYKLSKQTNNQVGIARALNGRGLIYLGRELYTEALIEFKTALEVNREIIHHKSMAVNLLNIGICYQALGNWNQAYQAYLDSYKISVENDLETYALMDMNRLGTLFIENQQLDSAEYYLMKVYESESNRWEESYNLSGLTELEIKKGNYSKAIEYGLSSYEISKEIGAKWDASEVALKLSVAYDALKLFNKALEYHQIHKAYSDSLLNEEMNREINWAELQLAKSENEQLMVQKDLLSSDKDRGQLIIALLSSLVLFLLMLALLYRRNIKQKEQYSQNLGTINKELAEKKIQIEKQNEDLKQINDAKNRLFSILSHDLRSPINSVKQLLDIRSSVSDEDVEKYMERLTNEVGNVNNQINYLLKWANTQMDGFKTNPKSVRLDTALEKNLNSISYIAKEKGIELRHNATKNYVYIDPEQLSIIINNLLSNSVKYTSIGGSININYSQHENSVLLSIEDTGIGMDHDTLAQLKGEAQERSFSRKGTDKEIGTGLGMLLVKQFLAYNHANMEIESEEGKGTRFLLTFPKAKESV